MNRQRLDSPLVYVGAHNVYYVKLPVKVLYFTIHIHTQINQYQLYAYTGFPRSLNALNELMKVVETRKQRGIEDIEGKAPIARIPVGDELRRVGTANQTKISGAPVQGPLFDFAPTLAT